MTDATGAVGRSPVVRVSAAPTVDAAGPVVDAAADAADAVPVVRTGPAGAAALEPLVLATRDGRTAFLRAPTPAAVRETVAELEAGRLPTDGADAVVGHDPGTTTLPVPEEGPLSVGRRRVLGPCGWVDPLAPPDLPLVAPDRDAGAAAGLGIRGRGRGDAAADDPVGDAWERVRGADGDPVVVANANEADDRPLGDRTLLAAAPLAVLDGVAAVASHVGATDAVIYLNETDAALVERVRRAIDAAADADALPVRPQVVVGPDAYRAGAPTAALESMEGADRVEPRLRPPGPAEHGLHGRPTVVHTPRTFAQIRAALRDPDSVDPDAPDPGTRIVTVTGDVAAPATVELASGDDLATARAAVRLDGDFGLACVGGVFGGVTDDLAVPASGPALSAAGLGTGGVVELLADDRCPVAVAGERARFAAEANSGRCVPGREGTKQLTELLREVYDGSFREDDVRELGRVMRRTSNCRLGARAPRPVTTAMDAFGSAFRAHADGRCPTGACEGRR